MSASLALARAAAATSWRDLPQDVRDQAADLILDALGVIAAGGQNPQYAAYAKASGTAQGLCTIVGEPHRTGAAAAALINGGATTVLQLQDGHRVARGHPAAHLVPAALAIAEEQGASAQDFLSAFVAGYEASVRIGIALGGLKPEIHDAGTWSTFGAAVAATFLITRDPAVIASAMDSAAAIPFLSWSQTAPQGAGMHHLCIGLAASTGVTVAYGAVAGLSSIPGAVETFFGPRAGAAFKESRLLESVQDGRWSHYELMHAYMKVHPTCAHLHGINDAVEHLIAKHAITGAAVAAVEIASYAHGLAYDNHAPKTELAARFSAAYTTAIALLRGTLDADAVTAAALSDPAVTALVAKITVMHDPALDQHYPAGRPSRVTITMNDGRTFSEFCMYPRGDSTNPTTRAERRAKAQKLLAVRFGAGQADRIIAAFDGILTGGSLSAFAATLRGE